MKTEWLVLSRVRVGIVASVLSVTLTQPFLSDAHEVIVHKQITLHSASSVKSRSQGYKAFLDTIKFLNGEQRLAYGGDFRTIDGDYGWLTIGSMNEDGTPPLGGDEGGWRVFNHFYNPLNSSGLSDIPPILGNLDILYGQSSFEWAAWFDSPGLDVAFPILNVNTRNKWSWQNARAFELLSLTESNPGIREGNLAQ